MARSQQGLWLPLGFFLSERQSGRLIAESLAVILNWCGGHDNWQLRFFQTDDSAAEQIAVRLAFPKFTTNSPDFLHLLCTRHFVETVRRHVKNPQARAHMEASIYRRSTEKTCWESMDEAKKYCGQDAQRWIEKQKVNSRQWAYWGRSHLPLLLQATTTNHVESWHHSLKKDGEKQSMRFYSLLGTIKRASISPRSSPLKLTAANYVVSPGN